MIPGRAVRRLLAPVWVGLGTTAAIVAGPLEAIAERLSGLLGGNRQPVYVTRFAVLYLRLEASFIVVAAALWFASGLGARLSSPRFVDTHFRLEQRFFGRLVTDVRRTLGISVALEDSGEAEEALLRRDRPLLVFSRHAGPGDSFLLVDLMLRAFGRRPRIVMKDALALDPVIDLLAQRLPNVLLDSRDPDRGRQEIAAVATELEDAGVLVLFPEGGNYTPVRRRAAIRKLLRLGRHREAAKATRMEHLLPPRPAGALAAMIARPDADVVFVAHTGLGREAFGSQLFLRMPTDRTWRVRMWVAPAASRPAEEDAQTEWLYAWWQRMEEWVAPAE